MFTVIAVSKDTGKKKDIDTGITMSEYRSLDDA
jgi:hypothetical protein